MVKKSSDIWVGFPQLKSPVFEFWCSRFYSKGDYDGKFPLQCQFQLLQMAS